MDKLSDDEVWVLTALRLGVTRPKTREEFSTVIDILDNVPVLDALAWDCLAGDDETYLRNGMKLLTEELIYYFENVLPDVEKWVYEKLGQPINTLEDLKLYKEAIEQWIPRFKFRLNISEVTLKEAQELRTAALEYSIKRFSMDTDS